MIWSCLCFKIKKTNPRLPWRLVLFLLLYKFGVRARVLTFQIGMPRFTKAMGDCIKAKMLQRLDTMIFSEQDVQDVARDSELDEVQIKQWTAMFRFRYGSKSREEIEAYLRNDEKVRDRLPILGFEKVSKSELWHVT